MIRWNNWTWEQIMECYHRTGDKEALSALRRRVYDMRGRTVANKVAEIDKAVAAWKREHV